MKKIDILVLHALLFVSSILLITGCVTAHRPRHVTQTITSHTEFVANCPYCGKVNVSATCSTSGSVVTNSITVQTWSINYKCRCCEMPYGDTRVQTLPAVHSVMLTP